MALETPPIELKSVGDEERLLGGDVVWWGFLLVVSVPVILFGIALAPQIIGFVILSVAGVAGGVAFAMIALRLPYFTHRFLLSMFLVVVALAVIGGAAQLFNMSLPVPTPSLDTMYKPPISGG